MDDDDDDDWEDNEALYARFAERLNRLLRNKVAPNAVNDLMHDTFIRVFEARGRGPIRDRSGQPYRSPWAYICGVAQNVLREHWRANKRSDKIGDYSDFSVADMTRGMSSRMSLEERRVLIHELLREIPFSHQMTVECLYLNAMTYKEISEMLGVPIGTVATWCRRGRKELRELLETHFAGQPIPKELVDDTEAQRRARLKEYDWYDPETSALDLGRLALSVVNNDAKPSCKCGTVKTPAWISALELPATLPEATPFDLYQVSRAAWYAWREAQSPALQCDCDDT